MTEDVKYELIEKFLEERLSESEAQAFKALVETDKAFRQEVQGQLDVQCALQAIYSTNKKGKAKKDTRTLPLNRTRIYLILSLAACLVILIAFGYTYYYLSHKLSNTNLALENKIEQQTKLQEDISQLQQQLSLISDTNSLAIVQAKKELAEKEKQITELNEQISDLRKGPTNTEKEQIVYAFLSDKYFKPIEGDAASVRSTNSDYVDAVTLYYDKKYTEANLLFKKLLVTSTGSLLTDVTFYYGSSCLALAQHSNSKELLEKAAELFETIVEMPANPLYDEAKWNLALTYLKMGKKEECTTLLQKIIDSNGYNNKEAESLLVMLKE